MVIINDDRGSSFQIPKGADVSYNSGDVFLFVLDDQKNKIAAYTIARLVGWQLINT